jgi:hypothetical protein
LIESIGGATVSAARTSAAALFLPADRVAKTSEKCLE